MHKVAAYSLGLGLLILLCFAMLMERTDTPTPAPATVARLREPANPKRLAECQKLLARLSSGKYRVVESWEQNGDVVRVHVLAAFYLATLKQKSVFNSIILCVAAEGRNEDRGITLVRYMDAHNGKRVARWGDSTGLEMME